MSVSTVVIKRCTKKKAHSPHTWWSRRRRCYFRCFGKQ